MSTKRVLAYTHNSHDTRVAFEVDQLPDSCPACHAGIEPIWKYGWIEGSPAYAVYQCPKSKCSKLFISYFEKSTNYRDDRYIYKGSGPWRALQRDFPNEIKTLSPRFCSIYDESHEAEQRELTQICGAGYRKALEILIKDYLINEAGLEEEIIKKKSLGNCIEEHIDDKRINACAKRAAWLGNDETHYYRIWESKDLDDLKTLIELTGNWIHNDCLTKRFITEMPDKKEGGKK